MTTIDEGYAKDYQELVKRYYEAGKDGEGELKFPDVDFYQSLSPATASA